MIKPNHSRIDDHSVAKAHQSRQEAARQIRDSKTNEGTYGETHPVRPESRLKKASQRLPGGLPFQVTVTSVAPPAGTTFVASAASFSAPSKSLTVQVQLE